MNWFYLRPRLMRLLKGVLKGSAVLMVVIVAGGWILDFVRSLFANEAGIVGVLVGPFVAIFFFGLGLFLKNRGKWRAAQRTTDFGLLGVRSEWDTFWYPLKIKLYTFVGHLCIVASPFLLMVSCSQRV